MVKLAFVGSRSLCVPVDGGLETVLWPVHVTRHIKTKLQYLFAVIRNFFIVFSLKLNFVEGYAIIYFVRSRGKLTNKLENVRREREKILAFFRNHNGHRKNNISKLGVTLGTLEQKFP